MEFPEDEEIADASDSSADSEREESVRFVVPLEWSGYRLDRTLALRLPDHSRSLLQKLILEGNATADGLPMRPSHKVKQGDVIEIRLPPSAPPKLVPESIPLDIRFEDDQLLVIDKPSGMVVHPAPGARTGTLAHAVLAHCPEGLSRVGGESRPGIVHRLDKDTSGLILVAKTDAAHRSLSRQIQEREIRRRYLALVWGTPRFQKALIDAPIGRDPADRKRMAVLPLSGPSDAGPRSRAAQTEVSVAERYGFCSLLGCRLRTGRTHQIRVHLSHIGHPVVGDPTYGGDRRLPAEALGDSARRNEFERLRESLNGQALHAYSISFLHPSTGERMEFVAEPPAPFAALLDFLRASVR
jgi:23S rRNA pseudouridine1911/1915/1917 synthase